MRWKNVFVVSESIENKEVVLPTLPLKTAFVPVRINAPNAPKPSTFPLKVVVLVPFATVRPAAKLTSPLKVAGPAVVTLLFNSMVLAVAINEVKAVVAPTVELKSIKLAAETVKP